MLELSSALRSSLRARAHALHPVVQIGDQGVSQNVLKEIDRSLAAHELIKIKVASGDRAERNDMLDTICDQLNCSPVQHLGRTLVVYRPAASADSIFNDPIERKPSEPYTPKKLAAAGKKRTHAGPTGRRKKRPAPSF